MRTRLSANGLVFALTPGATRVTLTMHCPGRRVRPRLLSCDSRAPTSARLAALTGVVEGLLADTGLDPSKLGVEVTERQLARRVDDVASDLTALRELGIAMSVDDFGTGYASLDYLRRFEFDDIKIDRSFVSGLNNDRTDTAVIASIIALGAALDLTVIAEGIEAQDQYDRLQQLGCPVSQGYLLHRPAPPETITRLLHKTTTPQNADRASRSDRSAAEFHVES
jgi:EAL domain-containing protein (putative c-di-GMP-specific phosphodiesterase class I)